MRIVFAKVMAVVGGYERNFKIFFQPKQVLLDAVLHLQALILDLEKEILFTKNIAVGSGGRPRSFVLIFGEALRHLAFQTS